MSKYLKAEWLFPIYFWGFIFLKIFYSLIDSTVLLISFVCVSLFLFISKYNFKIININSFFILIIALLLFFDTFLRIENTISINYFKEFLYFGFIPFLLFSKICDYNFFLYNFSKLSLLNLLIFGFDGIMGYPVFGDYMSFGFNLILPCLFSCLYLLLYSDKFKFIYVFFLIFSLYNALIYSNRGVLLSFFCFIIFILYHNKKSKTIYFFVLPFFSVIAFFLKDILLYIFEFADKNQINSYSLNQYREVLLGQSNQQDFFSGRFDIWNLAVNMLNERIFFGNGIGSFENLYGVYTHNFILDILIFHGVILSIILMFFLFKSSINLYKTNKFLFGFVFFLVFPKIFLSTYYLKEVFFWVLISFVYVNKNFKSRYFKIKNS